MQIYVSVSLFSTRSQDSKNVIIAVVTHSAVSYVPHACSYHILTLSLMYY